MAVTVVHAPIIKDGRGKVKGISDTLADADTLVFRTCTLFYAFAQWGGTIVYHRFYRLNTSLYILFTSNSWRRKYREYRDKSY